MEHKSAREAAVEAVISWADKGRRVPRPPMPVQQLFGVNVFCLEGFDPADIPVRETVGTAMP